MTATAVLENTLKHRYEAPASALARVMAEAAYFPRVSDNKSAALSRPTEYAIRWPYMQLNRRDFVSWLIFDCDHGDIDRYERVGLPAPNLIVSSMKDGRVTGFHLLYAIEPVCTSPAARPHPIRYKRAVYDEMARLLDADPDYHGGPICKTPGHPWWHTNELHAHEYSLGELHEYFDIPSEKPRYSKGPDLHPLTHSRALTLFEQLRFFAYAAVNTERERGNFESFTRRVTDYADQINDFGRRGFRDFRTGAPKDDLPASALRYTVKSVARWTWDHYRGDGRCNRGVMQLDQSLPLADRQRLAAQRTHSQRKQSTADRVRGACAMLREKGAEITQTAVARITRLTRQTVATYRALIDEYLSKAAAAPVPGQAARKPSDVKFGVYQVAPGVAPDVAVPNRGRPASVLRLVPQVAKPPPVDSS